MQAEQSESGKKAFFSDDIWRRHDVMLGAGPLCCSCNAVHLFLLHFGLFSMEGSCVFPPSHPYTVITVAEFCDLYDAFLILVVRNVLLSCFAHMLFASVLAAGWALSVCSRVMELWQPFFFLLACTFCQGLELSGCTLSGDPTTRQSLRACCAALVGDAWHGVRQAGCEWLGAILLQLHTCQPFDSPNREITFKCM